MKKTYLIAIYLILLTPCRSMSEVICSTDISYSWQRAEEESGRSTRWSFAEQRGKTEEEARASLAIRIEADKAKALYGCRREHENLSGCISAKLAAMASTINAAGFSARKALEEAAVKDCEKGQGKCLDAVASEIKCVTIEAAPTAAAEDPAKDKDKKKKKG